MSQGTVTNDLHYIPVLIHSRWLSHTPYISHIIFTILQWLINISSFHTLVRLMLSPLPFHISFLYLFNPYEILQITDAITLKVWFFYAPTQFNSLSSAMMSIWTRWLKPCLIGLSTSLHKIITVSQYSPPLIIIVSTLSECWSTVVIFACRCLYYHSTAHQWEWERIDLLLIYSCCLLIEKTHLVLLFAGPPRLSHKFTGYGSTWIGWDTWTTLEVRILFSLWFFIAHPVSQSIDDSHLSSPRFYCLHIRPRL